MQTGKMFKSLEGFDWDKGNIDKSKQKHGVTAKECEEIFFNQPLLINFDLKHSDKENRFQALGRTDRDRRLFLVFTIRNKLIRVISARDQSREERKHYEKAKRTA